jgi:penicillin-binding protein 1B
MAEVDKRTSRKAEAALIAIDPHTGEIKAVVGGRDYARSQLNRVLAKRPPGSVFKPFVYATAIDSAINGASQTFTPASMVDDSPQAFGAYRPANFRNESFGNLTFRQALAKSDNVAAVKVAEMVGYGNVVAMARRAGLNGNIMPTPSVALGTYDVTPLEMAGAYTAFANGGVWIKPHIIANVGTDSHLADSHQAMDPRVAYLITNMMQEVLRTGTGAGVRSRGFIQPAAGKTGTSHDGWFAGFTSNLLCVVWVGFDDYKELGLEGAKSALPIWTAFMKKAAHNGKEFPMPRGIESAKICNRSGKLAGDYCTDTRNEVFIAGTQPVDQCDLDVPLPLPTVAMPVVAPLIAPPQP